MKNVTRTATLKLTVPGVFCEIKMSLELADPNHTVYERVFAFKILQGTK